MVRAVDESTYLKDAIEFIEGHAEQPGLPDSLEAFGAIDGPELKAAGELMIRDIRATHLHEPVEVALGITERTRLHDRVMVAFRIIVKAELQDPAIFGVFLPINAAELQNAVIRRIDDFIEPSDLGEAHELRGG